MKILMITPSYFPIVGGTERCVENLALKLNEIGVHADVMTFNMDEKYKPVWREEVEQNGFKLFRVSAFNPFPKLKINPLAMMCGAHVIPRLSFVKRLLGYDLLHFHDEVDLSFPIFSWFVDRPKIFQCHTLAGTYPRYKRSYFQRAILNNVGTTYLCVSTAAKKLLSDLGVPESKIQILPNGVDLQRFKPEKAERIANLILFVGRIERAKGLHVLLDALNYLDIPVSLKIAGPKQDCAYIEEILGASDKQKRGIHEIELLGSLDQDNLVKWYRRASIFVNPALKEEFGIVNLEAASCQTPLISSGVGGMTDFVKQGVNGIIVPPNDPRKLANALKYLLENEDLREEYGKNARRIVEEHFSWESVARKAAKIYEQVIRQEK